MSKLVIILLIVALESGILFAGQIQTQVAITESPDTSLAPLSASGPLRSGTPDTKHLSTAGNIVDFFYGFTQPAYGLRSTHFQRHIPGVTRHGYGEKTAKSCSREIAQQTGRSILVAPESPSANLSPLSPTVLVLRL